MNHTPAYIYIALVIAAVGCLTILYFDVKRERREKEERKLENKRIRKW